MDIRPPSLSEKLSKMMHHGLIVRTKNKKDSRAIDVSITNKGRDQLKKNDALFEALNIEVNEVLTTEEREKFADISQKLIAYFESKGSNTDTGRQFCHDEHRKYGDLRNHN